MHVVAGLTRVVSAEVCVLVTGKRGDASVVVDEWLDHGWRTDGERTAFHEAYQAPTTADPLIRDLMHAVEPFTRPVQPSENIRYDLHRPASVDATLMSLARPSEGEFRLLVFKRAWGARAFDDEDCALVDLFRAEFEPLFTAVRDPELSPRERGVLALLMDGLPEKQIAAQLAISVHTAHTYIKAVYRKLGVRSRAQLMARARHSPI